jgi:electron transfer flavoprotein beta subunit
MGIRKAAKVQIPVWDAGEIGAAKERIGSEAAAVKVIELTTPPPRSGGEVLKGEIDEVSNLLVEKLLGLKVIK